MIIGLLACDLKLCMLDYPGAQHDPLFFVPLSEKSFFFASLIPPVRHTHFNYFSSVVVMHLKVLASLYELIKAM